MTPIRHVVRTDTYSNAGVTLDPWSESLTCITCGQTVSGSTTTTKRADWFIVKREFNKKHPFNPPQPLLKQGELFDG